MSESPNSYKVVLVGSSGVGKTSLVNRLVNNVFAKLIHTIGVEFKSHSIISNDVEINLQLWDTAGKEVFRSVAKEYCRNSLGAILVFSLTDRQSFNNLEMWIRDIQSLCAPNAYIILVGNKSDDESRRLISNTEAQQFADRYGIEYFETSSKTGANVDTIFKTLGEGIFRRNNNLDSPKEEVKEIEKEEEEEEDNDNEFSLNPKNMYNFPFEKYAKDFTFILNGHRYQTSRIVADILSPTIRDMHLSDATIDEFIIETDSIFDDKGENEGEKYFHNFLNLCSFKPTVIDERSKIYYSQYFFLLGNVDEYSRLLPKYKDEDVDKALERLEFYVNSKSRYFNDNQLLSFIASHFYQLDQERLKNLPLPVIEMILFNSKLVVNDEDSLLSFINQLYEKDSSFSVLFGAVHFINVSKLILEEFLGEFKIEDLDTNIWKSISYRLMHFEDKDKDKDKNNIKNDKRYHNKDK